jgi:hypothetical protein
MFSSIDISSRFNTAGQEGVIDCDLRTLRPETIHTGKSPFRLTASDGKSAVAVATRGSTPTSLPSSVSGIPIHSDFSSILFLHACAKHAANREPDRLLWDVFDSADVLGWYEARYEDGFTETISIRYGVNIAEWNWQSRELDRDYCYGADPVIVSKEGLRPITMFAFEWENPRPGKVLSELSLNGTTGFRGADEDYTDHYGPVIADNAVMLVAVSIVNSRQPARND